MPQISVIVPIYNVDSYLDNCITSIINQTFRDLEIILIDDGSTDNSSSICDNYANNDTRIIVIHKKNEGLSKARNTGIKIAKGKYISFVDGDDYIHPQMMEIQYYFLSQNKDLSFAIVRENNVFQNSNILFHNINKSTLTTSILSKDYLIQSLYKKNTQYPPFLANVVHCKLYKSSIIRETLFSNFKISEDTEYNSRLYFKCTNAIFIDSPMYYYVHRDTSLSHQPLSSINHINRINMYHTCLYNTPTNDLFYRALVLDKMYKFMLNIRYHNRTNQEVQKKIATIIVHIKRKTFSELLTNSYISISKKIGFPIFIQFPILYTAFIGLVEQIYKLKKHVQ